VYASLKLEEDIRPAMPTLEATKLLAADIQWVDLISADAIRESLLFP
jgi:hypothetical protein